MKTSFFRRVGAFLIDYFILSFVLSIITMGFDNTSKFNDRMSGLMEGIQNNEITVAEYSEEIMELNYELQKSNLPVNAVSWFLTVGYFVVFNYLNKGQTLGKKLLKLRIVNKDNKRPSFIAILLRETFIYGILSGLCSMIFVNFMTAKDFGYGYSVIANLESIFVIVSFFMVLYREDRRGLHDMIAGTNVIEEVVNNG